MSRALDIATDALRRITSGGDPRCPDTDQTRQAVARHALEAIAGLPPDLPTYNKLHRAIREIATRLILPGHRYYFDAAHELREIARGVLGDAELPPETG